MLFVSMVLSLGLLFVFAYPRFRRKKTSVELRGLFALIGWPFGCVLPILMLQYLLLVGLFAADAYWRFSNRLYLTLGCIFTVFVYLITGLAVARNLASLQAEFPYESMEARLPVPPLPRVQLRMSAIDASLAKLEADLDAPTTGSFARNYNLGMLHEHTVTEFINSQGFGIGRLPGLNSKIRRGMAPGNHASAASRQEKMALNV